MTDKYDSVVAALAELIALTDTPPTLFTDAKEVLEALQRECDEWKAAAEASYGHDLETALSDLAAARADAARYRLLRDCKRLILRSGAADGKTRTGANL